MVGMVSLGWMDPRLRYNRQHFHNISMVRVAARTIWVPDIELFNSWVYFLHACSLWLHLVKKKQLYLNFFFSFSFFFFSFYWKCGPAKCPSARKGTKSLTTEGHIRMKHIPNSFHVSARLLEEEEEGLEKKKKKRRWRRRRRITAFSHTLNSFDYLCTN